MNCVDRLNLVVRLVVRRLVGTRLVVRRRRNEFSVIAQAPEHYIDQLVLPRVRGAPDITPAQLEKLGEVAEVRLVELHDVCTSIALVRLANASQMVPGNCTEANNLLSCGSSFGHGGGTRVNSALTEDTLLRRARVDHLCHARLRCWRGSQERGH